jgi:integrase
VQAFARERGALGGRAKGGVPPYLWAVMEIAYQVRLRGIEVITLTEANVEADAIVTNRRKGSLDNRTRIGPRLREALDVLAERRKRVLAGKRGHATPIRPDARPLCVDERGEPLSRSALDNGWGRLMRMAVAEGVITQGERFGLHGLKHRGITDTAGGLDEKQRGGGHRTQAMVHRYNHSLPVVAATDDAAEGAQ